jgi:hypothetical protein
MNLDTGHPADQGLTLRLRGPADLLVALPYLLGFHPRDSLVLVGTGSPRDPCVRFTLRVDLPPPGLSAGLARSLAGGVIARQCEELFIAVIGGAPPQPVKAGSGLSRPEVVDALGSACVSAGVRVRDVVWAAELVEGAAWRCYGECGCAGTLPDPACSPLAAASVAAGQVTYADRAELERVVAPGDPAVLRRRAALLNQRIDEAAQQGDRVAPTGMAAVDLVAHWVEVSDADRPTLDDEDVVQLCLALSDPLVRDVAFGFALGGRPRGAERLWSVLVTEAPDPEAAEPAVLLAHSALTTGDGALASVALERAQRAWPGHRLSAMIQSALAAATDPEVLCGWLAQGYEQAALLLARRDGER